MSILKFNHKIINEETINLFGDGSQERDFTYVEDICDGIISSSKLEGFQTLNLGSSKPYSLIDVLSPISISFITSVTPSTSQTILTASILLS